ncbi:MAG: hypothetical protein ACP5VE_04950, partial [Chthonomonadales bacterium]
MRATHWRSIPLEPAMRVLVLASLLAATPLAASAQRGEPNRPKETPSPPAPRRDYTPAPRRDYNPPQRDYT